MKEYGTREKSSEPSGSNDAGATSSSTPAGAGAKVTPGNINWSVEK